jgi:SAM-dependent MidA family methyltransferase
MYLALQHPEHGYYHNSASFKQDFVTAPEISSLFGCAIGKWIYHMLQQMNLSNISDLLLVELGPGYGTMMNDILSSAAQLGKLKVHLVESSMAFQAEQKKQLAGFDVCWHKEVGSLPDQPMLVLANEFFDALPIYQFAFDTHEGAWLERRLALADGQLKFVLESPSSSCLALALGKKPVRSGAILEICPQATSIMSFISEKIDKYGGGIVIIDYGYLRRPYMSTLQAVKQHQFWPILEDLGQADITAHVDFGALIAAASAYDNLKIKELISQGEFLSRLGIKETIRDLSAKKTANSTLQAMDMLTSKNFMGELFKVLVIYNKNYIVV